MERRQQTPAAHCAADTSHQKLQNFWRLALEVLAHLCKGCRLELADTFFAEAEFQPKTFKRAGVVAQFALLYDKSLAVAQRIHRSQQPLSQLIRVMLMLDVFGRLNAVIP